MLAAGRKPTRSPAHESGLAQRTSPRRLRELEQLPSSSALKQSTPVHDHVGTAAMFRECCPAGLTAATASAVLVNPALQNTAQRAEAEKVRRLTERMRAEANTHCGVTFARTC